MVMPHTVSHHQLQHSYKEMIPQLFDTKIHGSNRCGFYAKKRML